MNKKYNKIYIGYLIGYYFHDPVVLCVSDEKYKVKSYLHDVRKLSKGQYQISETVLDVESAVSLYEDYMLEEFREDILYLTTRDISYIGREIDATVRSMEGTYEDLKEYYKLISGVPKLESSLSSLKMAITTMEAHLSKVKALRRIANSIIKHSVVLSPNVLEYLQHMGYLQEDRELTELFYRKVNEK